MAEKKINEMTDKEFKAYREEWLEKNHTRYHLNFKCKDCGCYCSGTQFKTRKEAERDSLENYSCYQCGSINISRDGHGIWRSRNAVDLSRGGPAVGVYDVFKI